MVDQSVGDTVLNVNSWNSICLSNRWCCLQTWEERWAFNAYFVEYDVMLPGSLPHSALEVLASASSLFVAIIGESWIVLDRILIDSLCWRIRLSKTLAMFHKDVIRHSCCCSYKLFIRTSLTLVDWEIWHARHSWFCIAQIWHSRFRIWPSWFRIWYPFLLCWRRGFKGCSRSVIEWWHLAIARNFSV